MTERKRVFFQLIQDDEGYPPVSAESLWTIPVQGGRFVLDNVPFFARDATIGDTIEVREEEGRLWYRATVDRSGNSLLRVIMYDSAKITEVTTALRSLGCETELSEQHRLLAVSVPASASLPAVQRYLMDMASRDVLDYEEPLLRQDGID
ncbi:DUF4265 domain-containing protein [Corallococcus carmarthensis]|uniref:DUF4265 domain-containing protein n=1 Tax=Corallococcus carmarthensis TaxID=2316728 RepID=A0A3A8JCM7_9BACT|nr:DUF4265 domain-containing protein [Corallococcus carmarthensis]NOK23641.1 DUF4265 domain-containing protein [Corallococcus carmarthensis]RKG93429.1 DUF4265 domain-containing protein [Corallococcus carmarthensis]